MDVSGRKDLCEFRSVSLSLPQKSRSQTSFHATCASTTCRPTGRQALSHSDVTALEGFGIPGDPSFLVDLPSIGRSHMMRGGQSLARDASHSPGFRSRCRHRRRRTPRSASWGANTARRRPARRQRWPQARPLFSPSRFRTALRGAFLCLFCEEGWIPGPSWYDEGRGASLHH